LGSLINSKAGAAAADGRDKDCVLLAERHSALSDGIRGLLETTFDVVVMVADEASLWESLSRLTVTIAIIDLSVAGGEGVQLASRLRSRFPDLKFILTSVHDEPSMIGRALRDGADGFVVKRAIATDLLTTIDTVLNRKSAPPRSALHQS